MILKRDSVAHRLIFAVDLNKTGYSTCQVMSSFWADFVQKEQEDFKILPLCLSSVVLKWSCVSCVTPELRTDQTVDNTTFETIRDALESPSDSQIAFSSCQVLGICYKQKVSNKISNSWVETFFISCTTFTQIMESRLPPWVLKAGVGFAEMDGSDTAHYKLHMQMLAKDTTLVNWSHQVSVPFGKVQVMGTICT